MKKKKLKRDEANLHATMLMYLFLFLLSAILELSHGYLSLNDVLFISCIDNIHYGNLMYVIH